jgi:hypothetical protein
MVTESDNKAEPVMVPTAAAALAIARQLQLAVRAEAIAAIRRLRGEGRSWGDRLDTWLRRITRWRRR